LKIISKGRLYFISTKMTGRVSKDSIMLGSRYLKSRERLNHI